MFRAKKKGKKIRTVRKDDEGSSEEDDGENPPIVINRHKKRKAKGMVVKSVEEDESDNDIPKETKSKKKKKRNVSGMGFGGGIAPAVADEGVNEPMDEDEEAPSKSLYDKEALQKLKAEQKMAPARKEKVQDAKQPSEPAAKEDSTTANPEEGEGADFIALHEEPAMETDAQGASFSVPNSARSQFMSQEVEEDPEETNEWQNQLAKRAGLSSFNDPKKDTATSPKPPPALEDLKRQLQSTLDNLEKQHEDLGNAIMRREADLQQAQADRVQYEENLKETGTSCEYYQELRNDIANWVGALRDLQAKVKPVFDALLQLVLASFANAEEEWKRCPEDVFSLLHQMFAIDRVVGYQPPTPPLDVMAVTVDEFGRDVKSQFLRDREKRYMARLEAVGEGEGSLDYLWAEDSKLGGRKERYGYLQQALRVAMEDVDEHYTSLDKLIGVFDRWKQSYPEEYRQCYAVLSLGDLAATLVQADFCRTSALFGMFASNPEESSSDDSSSLLKKLHVLDDGIGLEQGDSGAVQRVLERVHIVLLLEVLKVSPSACFVSSTRSQALCRTMIECTDWIDKTTRTYSSLLKAVSNGIKEALDRIPILILKKGFDASDSAGGFPKEQVDHALQFAYSDQAKWIQQVLLNIMDQWIVALQNSPHYEDTMKGIFQFISERYLLLLSSLNKELASVAFAPIWKSICKSHKEFIDSPTYMIQSAAVRAAAMAYGLN